jgi:hypothetical protein
MSKRIWFGMLALLLTVGVSCSVYAQPGQWIELGNAKVNGQADHDTIQVNNNGTFRAIQIRVESSAVHFDHIIVRYGNGQHEQISVRDVVQAGTASRSIDLPGARRAIDKIDLWYQKAGSGHKPKVSIYGLH